MRYSLVAIITLVLASVAYATLDSNQPGHDNRNETTATPTQFDSRVIYKDWVEKVRPHSTRISTMRAISPAGQIGLVSASRSSDSRCSGCMGTIGLEAIVLNDNRAQVQSAYGAYIEATRDVGNAGTTHGVEIDVINKSGLIAANPVAMHKIGITPALWLASGGEAKVQPATMAMGVVSNGAKFDKGIVFQQGALTTRIDQKQEAISLPQHNAISFYDAKGNIIANIYGQGLYAGSIVNIRFDAGKLVFEKINGTPIFTVGQDELRIGGIVAANCSGPPSPAFKVTMGIVTHC